MLESFNIRTLTEYDLPMIFAWRNHPDVRQRMFSQHEISLEEHHKWYAKASLDESRRLLIAEEAGKAIGYAQLSHVTEGGIAEWGFYARPESPKGTGRKLGLLALNHAFDTLKLHKVCGQTIHGNHASIALHQFLGFKQEGVLRDHQCLHGRYFDLYYFGLLSSEWSPRKVI
jgi:UDP-4-amino-4,6-dideoxy-N-acetyl-beta-L-altrosamine N-acetyltransferase